MGPSLEELVERADMGALLVEVDRLSAAGDWDGLVRLRDRCEAAVELGKQLWPIAHYAEYRLALDAPGRWAASVLRPGAARFALGPLTEVAASTHAWEELADHLAASYVAASVAQERVIRGEDLTGDPRAYPDEVDLPLVLQDWEASYPLPVYRAAELHEPGPDAAQAAPVEVMARPSPPAELRPIAAALREAAATWVEQSNGTCLVVTVRGDAQTAAASLDRGRVTLTALRAGEALARIGWAAASGGAFGRRRGLAAGRATAFWVAHVAAGLPFPSHPDDLGERVGELGWYEVGPPEGGWTLRLALEDARGGWAAAIDARDRELTDPLA